MAFPLRKIVLVFSRLNLEGVWLIEADLRVCFPPFKVRRYYGLHLDPAEGHWGRAKSICSGALSSLPALEPVDNPRGPASWP